VQPHEQYGCLGFAPLTYKKKCNDFKGLEDPQIIKKVSKRVQKERAYGIMSMWLGMNPSLVPEPSPRR